MKKSHRSLIRYVGDWLPFQPNCRIYFQLYLLNMIENCFNEKSNHDDQSNEEKSNSADVSESSSAIDFFWYQCSPLSLADVYWLESKKPDSAIIQRAFKTREHILRRSSKKHKFFSRNVYSSLEDSGLVSGDCSTIQYIGDKSSPTPNTSSHLYSSTPTFVSPFECDKQNPSAVKRINELENELLKLRQQIALIVANQEKINSNQCHPGAPVPPAPSLGPAPGGPQTIPPVPPPPPPPPPPLLTPQPSVIEIIKKKKSQNSLESQSNCGKKGESIDMTEVLKGIGSVKLRSVSNRSPGGTPMRRPAEPANANDAASLIAQALKKKFAHMKLNESPDSPSNENSTFSPSPRQLPQNPIFLKSTPPGPHLLKSCKRRISSQLLLPVSE